MATTTNPQKPSSRHRRVAWSAAAALVVGLSLGLWQVHGHRGPAGNVSGATTRLQPPSVQSAPSARPIGGDAEFLQAQLAQQALPSAATVPAPERPLGGYAEWLQYRYQVAVPAKVAAGE
jgi:hypothetical protein